MTPAEADTIAQALHRRWSANPARPGLDPSALAWSLATLLADHAKQDPRWATDPKWAAGLIERWIWEEIAEPSTPH